MSKTIAVPGSISVVPSGYDSANSNYSSVSSSYPISNGYDGTSSTNYAYITCNTGSRATTYISYTFNVSAIPADATITSVTAKAKGRVSSTNYISTAVFQLYSGSTAKGSSTSARTTTATTYDLTPGSWTRSELNNIQVRYTGTRGTSNTSRAAYLYFYGADLEIEYTVNELRYTITATSSVSGVTVDPATQDIPEGDNATLYVYATSLDDVTITDNGTDITSHFIREEIDSSGTTERYPASYTTDGSISGTRYQSTVGCSVDNPSSQTGNDYASGGSSSSATIYYHFDFSEIPEDAIIDSMTVQARGHLENSSQSSERAELNVYHGTTAKGTMVEFQSTSSTTVSITPGTWTAAELRDDARVGFTIGYYGGLVVGITWIINWHINAAQDYRYYHTWENLSADHVVTIEEKGVIVPPEEDPQYNYYSLTISSINADTNPGTGTTRVVEGTNQTITISPTDPQLTLALDNGVDITSQLVGGTPTNTYTVTTQVSGASYGFNLNSSTGYYVSTNNGVSKSASVARLNCVFESDCLVTIQYINYAEEDYDYGMFGKLDTEVATDGLTAASGGSSPSDSTSNYQLARCSNSSSPQTITYQIPAGEHFIDIKYGKDDASDSNNDSLQWKVSSVEATSAGGDYTYTLTNINQKHSLIFVFGNVSYYFITSSVTGSARIFPDGQTVKLDGDSYRLTIVPNDTTATVTLYDNNVDRSSQMEIERGQDKQGNAVVNYIYSLSNISAAHTIVVNCGSGASATLYVKINDTWRPFSKVYIKQNGAWVEQSDWSSVFSTTANYVKG